MFLASRLAVAAAAPRFLARGGSATLLRNLSSTSAVKSRPFAALAPTLKPLAPFGAISCVVPQDLLSASVRVPKKLVLAPRLVPGRGARKKSRADALSARGQSGTRAQAMPPKYTVAGKRTLHDGRPFDETKEADRLMATAEDRQRTGFVEIPEGCGVGVADYKRERHGWTDAIDTLMVPELKRQLQKHCDDSKVGDILPHEIDALRKVCDVMLLHHIGHGAYQMHVQARRIVPIIGKFLELTDSACRISLYQPTFMMVVADLAFAIGGAVLQGNEDLARWVEGRLHAHKVTGGTGGNMAMDEHRDHSFLVDRFVQAGGDGAKVSQMRWTITSDGNNLYFVASTATGNGTFVKGGISGIYAYYKMSSNGGAVTVLVPVLAGQGVVGANSTGHAVFNFHGVAPFKVGPAPACALLARGA